MSQLTKYIYMCVCNSMQYIVDSPKPLNPRNLIYIYKHLN